MDKIKLSKEKQEEMKSQIIGFFQQEKGEEIGNLAAGILLDFILEKIAPTIYDQAVYDCYNFINDRAGDMLELQINQ